MGRKWMRGEISPLSMAGCAPSPAAQPLHASTCASQRHSGWGVAVIFIAACQLLLRVTRPSVGHSLPSFSHAPPQDPCRCLPPLSVSCPLFACVSIVCFSLSRLLTRFTFRFSLLPAFSRLWGAVAAADGKGLASVTGHAARPRARTRLCCACQVYYEKRKRRHDVAGQSKKERKNTVNNGARA
eukprot:6190008-Pleurochrysis_carterae.AAC.2